MGTPISEETMLEYLNKDSLEAEHQSREMFPQFSEYPGEVQLVLANMMFNLGPNR